MAENSAKTPRTNSPKRTRKPPGEDESLNREAYHPFKWAVPLPHATEE